MLFNPSISQILITLAILFSRQKMYIQELKFSLWADFIEREFLETKFQELIKSGIINGATSNPSIFKNAILTSSAYKEQIASLGDVDAKTKYEAVAIHDISRAADILKPLYESGNDGYVSIEVDPFLCDDADATIAEGKRLHAQIGRDNVMIKVPATEAGFVAMEELVASNIAVNATLIFSKDQAIKCAKAFERGLQRATKDISTVISIFISRIDRALDDQLISLGITPSLSGIYNGADIYSSTLKMGVKNSRVLFASTGVKGDKLPPQYYIDNLLAYNSVNTAPIETIDAFVKGGCKAHALPIDQSVIDEHFEKIKNAGIDFDEVVQKQIDEGLVAFKDAFRDILKSI
jgi:transaldolase